MKPSIAMLLLTILAPQVRAADGADKDRPFLAIWRDSEGMRIRSDAPYLRIAIWNDGRIMYATDTNRWNHNLREGRIDAERIADLKKALVATRVFQLEGTAYLVPDAPVDCMMLDLGEKQQMLRWDEVETPGYGININPQPQHLEFIRCWKEVNRLALGAIPTNSVPHTNRFQRPPASWRLKPAIQSR